MAKKPWHRALLEVFHHPARKASYVIIDSVIAEVGELTYQEMRERPAVDFTYVDYETAIAGVAAATGERVLLATEPDLSGLEPGRVIPPDVLERMLAEDNHVERAWRDLTRTFEDHLVSADDVPTADEMIARARAAAEGGPWPVLTVPSDHLPQRDVLELAAAMQFDVDWVIEKFRLDAEREVEAWMLSTVQLAGGRFSQLLDTKIGTRLAAEVLLSVAMTTPLER